MSWHGCRYLNRGKDDSMRTVIAFVAGLFIGALIGFLVTAILTAQEVEDGYYDEITSDYDFDKYDCGVTGNTCSGCSLFCEHRRRKKDE